MAGLASELIVVLNEQLECYKGLVASSKVKKTAIVNNKVEEIKKANEGEQGFIGRIQRLDKTRQQVLKDISSVIAVPYREITMTKIAEKMGDHPDASELRKLTVELRDCLQELSEINGLNNALIQNALDYVDFSINVIRSTYEDGSELYNTSGMRSGSAFVDRKN